MMCLQNMGDSKLYLQQCQPHGQTLTWSCTKRHVQHGVTLGFFFWTKPGTIGICWYLSTRTSLILNVNITTRLHGTDPNNRHYYAKLSFIFKLWNKPLPLPHPHSCHRHRCCWNPPPPVHHHHHHPLILIVVVVVTKIIII